MKATNLAIYLIAALTVMVLDACSPNSNGSNPAAAVATCTMGYNGSYVDQNGNICNPAGNTSVCPANGQYYLNGQYTPCTPGQIVTGGYPGYGGGGSYYPPTGYNYPTYPSTGCSQWQQIYGQPYVPMYLNGQLVCANYYDLLSSMQQTSYYSSYYQSTPYYQYGPQYYYAYPPYSSGGGCDTGFSFSYQDFGAAFCF